MTSLTESASQVGAANVLSVGSRAPSIKVEDWLRGQPVTRFEPGKVYITEFWARWCGPCIASMRNIVALQDKYRSNGVQVLGIAAHEQTSTDNEARASLDSWFTKTLPNLNFAIASTAPTKWTRFEGIPAFLSRVPPAFVVDRDGRVACIGHPAQCGRHRRLSINYVLLMIGYCSSVLFPPCAPGAMHPHNLANFVGPNFRIGERRIMRPLRVVSLRPLQLFKYGLVRKASFPFAGPIAAILGLSLRGRWRLPIRTLLLLDGAVSESFPVEQESSRRAVELQWLPGLPTSGEVSRKKCDFNTRSPRHEKRTSVERRKNEPNRGVLFRVEGKRGPGKSQDVPGMGFSSCRRRYRCRRDDVRRLGILALQGGEARPESRKKRV
ncbi:redoxin family protein [Bradyrhizobium canariense]|nr:redoxin family protein [Bradyrhizobium canariense]